MLNNMKNITVAAGELAYRDSAGPAPAIFFLHSNSASSEIFGHQLEAFEGRWRLIAPDLPGQGESGNAREPGRDYALPGYAAAMLSLLDALSIEQAVIVGHSMGANIAMELAATSPHRVAGVMAIGAVPLSADPTLLGEGFLPNDNFGLVFQESFSPQEAELFAHIVFQGSDAAPDFLIENCKRTDGQVRAQLGVSLGAGDLTDQQTFAAAGQVPLAMVLGENDSYIDKAFLETLEYGNLWRNKIVTVPEAGHAPFWQAPSAFNEVLEAFFADINQP